MQYIRMDWTLSEFVKDRWTTEPGDPVIMVDISDEYREECVSLGREDLNLPTWLSASLIPDIVRENMYHMDTSICYVRLRYTENDMTAKYWALRDFYVYQLDYEVQRGEYALYLIAPTINDIVEKEDGWSGFMTPDCHPELIY